MKRLADEPMLIALPSHHPLAVHPKLPISALANEAFVLFPRIVGLSLYDDVVEACRNAGFEMIVAQEAPQMPSVVNLVVADLGVSIVPAAIAQIKLAGVTYRPIREPLLARLGLVSMKNNRSPLIDNLTSLLPDQ